MRRLVAAVTRQADVRSWDQDQTAGKAENFYPLTPCRKLADPDQEGSRGHVGGSPGWVPLGMLWSGLGSHFKGGMASEKSDHVM